MAQTPRGKSAPKRPAHGKEVPGVLIRGADGRLYLITENDLRPFAVELTPEKEKQLTEILGGAQLTMPKLPPDVVKQLQSFFICVLCHYPEIEL